MFAKTAIVYFSRSGHSEKIALQLSHALNGDLLQLSDPRFGPGPLGYMRAAWHSLQQDGTLTHQTFDTLGHYETLVLCGPIWTSYPAVPLRALMRSKIHLPDRVGMFLTCGSHSPPQKAFDSGAADLGRAFAATGSLSNAAQKAGEDAPVLAAFVAALQEGPVHAASA